ncbi:MAG: hypothetical protein WD508_10425 [Chloroflexota bacterium]
MPRIPAQHVGTAPNGVEIYRPIVLIRIEIGGLAVEAPGLVDSGADNTLVPDGYIAALGVAFKDLPILGMGTGPGGGLQTRLCTGRILYNGILVCDSFTVAKTTTLDSVLLGRADFFTKFVPRFLWHKNPPEFDLDPVSEGKAAAPRKKVHRR